ncbi:hypothetical protein JOM56_001318 [Amanita muscaria]
MEFTGNLQGIPREYGIPPGFHQSRWGSVKYCKPGVFTRTHAENNSSQHSPIQDDSELSNHAGTESSKTQWIQRSTASRTFKTESESTSPTPQGRVNDDRPSPQVWKPPDESNTRLHRLYGVDNNVDSTSVERHSPSKYKAQVVPIRPTRGSEFLASSREPLQRVHGNQGTEPHPLRARKLPDNETSKFHGSYVVNHDIDSTSAKEHSPMKPEAQTVPPRPTRSLQQLLESYPELEWRARSKAELCTLARTHKPPDKSVSRGFQSKTLEFIKSGMQHLSKMLLPAFDSVLRRQARLAPCLEPNG